MDKHGRYCRYHESPQRIKPTFAQRIKTWVWGGMLHKDREGRKRIMPGYENTNLGAGWNRVDPQK